MSFDQDLDERLRSLMADDNDYGSPDDIIAACVETVYAKIETMLHSVCGCPKCFQLRKLLAYMAGTSIDVVTAIEIQKSGLNLTHIQTPLCPICERTVIVTVPTRDWERWQNGWHPQDAFPYLTSDARELIMTGIHPECWEEKIAPLAYDSEE